MSLTLARLQALKRQAGGDTPTAAAPCKTSEPLLWQAPGSDTVQTDAPPSIAPSRHMPAPVSEPRAHAEAGPASTRTKAASQTLDHLRQLLRTRTAAPRPVRHASDRTLPCEEIAPGLRLIQSRQPADTLPHLLDGTFDRRSAFDPRQLLFFDTETTGLAGGTGTRAFMIGAAHFDGGELHIRQLLITTLAAEPAMLAEFARWLTPDTLLASYNGKSYDAPLLRTRWRLHRQPDPTAGLPHIDLLYPSRRRWRGVYENCRLATIERHALGIVREDDLPGSEAPAAWLNYLRGGSARNLRRVAEHNHQDVVTLARLVRELAG